MFWQKLTMQRIQDDKSFYGLLEVCRLWKTPFKEWWSYTENPIGSSYKTFMTWPEYLTFCTYGRKKQKEKNIEDISLNWLNCFNGNVILWCSFKLQNSSNTRSMNDCEWENMVFSVPTWANTNILSAFWTVLKRWPIVTEVLPSWAFSKASCTT